MAREFSIQWTNRYSNEKGYVKTIRRLKRHFVNTFDIQCARKFSRKELIDALDTLNSIGEAVNNKFTIVNLRGEPIDEQGLLR